MAFLIGGANSAADTGYNVDNSCRFNDGDSPSMNKTASSGNTQHGTFSAWVKRGPTGDEHRVINAFIDGNNFTSIAFRTDDTIEIIHQDSGSTTYRKITTAVYRDPAAWMHLCVIFDLDDGTAEDRVKLFVNGTRVTVFGTNTNPGDASKTMDYNNSSATLNIGQMETDNYFDGYMAEVVWIDGLALAATSFGEFDEDSPTIFKPIDVSGLTFGTNGFYLDFEDSANLGNDANGGTDLTESNLAATDQATDTPTNNFTTLNPLDHNNVTFSEGNLKGSCGSSGTCRSTMAVNKGKWYWEFKYIDPEGFHGIRATHLGVTDNTFSVKIFGLNDPIEAHINGSQNDLTGRDNMSDNDILNFALDMDNNRFAIGQNGAWDNGSAFSGTTLNYHSITGGHYYSPQIATGSGTGRVCEVNFGSPSFAITSGNADANGYGNFEFAVPSGFFSLCSKNLAEYG